MITLLQIVLQGICVAIEDSFQVMKTTDETCPSWFSKEHIGTSEYHFTLQWRHNEQDGI